MTLVGPSISGQSPTIRLDTIAAVEAHLDVLVTIDPRLIQVRAAAGPVAPRVNAPGFAGLAKVICGQQLSVASAAAIWARYEALEGALDPLRYLHLAETAVRGVGFSAGKFRTVRAIAQAVAAGALDFAHVETLPATDAVKYLTAHKGIGPWTAEVYLMFCAGHPDVFPAGDLALLKAAHWGLELYERPSIKQMAQMATTWAPYRSSAALLLWRYFAVMKGREGVVA